MSNLALYRKYRSADFSEVVGQPHVVKTLQNAIASGKHSHAYLLTGPRGVGKTTVARLIAKQINGLGKEDSLADQLDIIEIDGASNRGIDEVRSLREKIVLTPTKLKYKVYIIDEVHMLTKEAFNALLKTLEEPPEHAVFVFATTEAQKLPETIISRTQRFDFRPIPEAAMRDHLKYIAKQEKIEIDNDAIAMICRLSRGGFRDAISFLDQIAASEDSITASTVAEFSGLQDPSVISELILACSQNNSSAVVKQLKNLFSKGADVAILTQQMLDQIQADLEGDKPKYELGFMIALTENLHWVQTGLKTTSVPQLLLQTAILRSMNLVGKSNTTTASTKSITKVSSQQSDSLPSPSKPTSVASDDSRQIKALSIVKHYNNSLYAVLRGSQLEIKGDEITVTCRFSFHRDRIVEPRNLALIEKAFSKVFETQMHVKTMLDNGKKDPPVDREKELMSSAMAILGGEVVDG